MWLFFASCSVFRDRARMSVLCAAGAVRVYCGCREEPDSGSLPERDALAPLAQLVEQLTLNQWVQGSSPWRCIVGLFTRRVHLFPFRTQKLSSAVPTIPGWRRSGKIGHSLHSSLAQSVEHVTVNHGVVGSSPTGGARSPVRKDGAFPFHSRGRADVACAAMRGKVAEQSEVG